VPRYVILEHDHPELHWDLMLEAGAALRTWRLRAPLVSGRAVDAEAAPDHRLYYLDYEGPISGGRGKVARWDAGTLNWLEQQEARVVVCLKGGQLHGLLIAERSYTGPWRVTFTQQDG
jgi:hypothetical protein